MGANLVGDGATFRVWAPARDARVRRARRRRRLSAAARRTSSSRTRRPATGPASSRAWSTARKYRFFVVGAGGSGFKRDPWARELELYDYPDCDCIVRDPDSYPWHDAGFRPPAFNDLVVYQFHVGRFFARDDAGRDRRPGPRGEVPRRARPDRVPRRPRHQRAPAAAGGRVRRRVEPRLQRHRHLLARDGLRRRPGGPAAVPRARQRAAREAGLRAADARAPRGTGRTS